MKRVAITGLGTVCPLGLSVDAVWTALMDGKSGINKISHFDAQAFPARIAAEIKNFTTHPKVHPKLQRLMTPLTDYALHAAIEAIDDSGLELAALSPERCGVVVGSGMMTAEYPYLKRFQEACAPDGTVDWSLLTNDFYTPYDFGKTTSNAGLSFLVQQFGFKGYATSVHTACASSGQALGLAMQAIRRGEADVIVAGGFDSMISPLGLSSFCLLGALSTYNESPESASRPFDATRNGFVLGEGAAFLILESFENAQARGARIYAELKGEGNSLSAYRITDSHPSGDGAIQAIAWALKDAGITPDMVDHINAHGTSTKMNDLSETNAIKHVFGSRAYEIPIAATKSQTGHLIAAAGALEAVFSVLSIHHGRVPGTANFTQQDAECDLDYGTNGPRNVAVNTVLSNSFGFGGSNSCLVFQKI